jgi:hypothetical protein
MMTEGPAARIATEEPRKKEPPMTVPNAIMVNCNADRPLCVLSINFSPLARQGFYSIPLNEKIMNITPYNDLSINRCFT